MHVEIYLCDAVAEESDYPPATTLLSTRSLKSLVCTMNLGNKK